MERQIKFRVWDDSPIKDGFLGLMITHEYALKSSYLIDALVGKYPLMQFTGLKDKNGVDIYEGDILKPTIKSNKILGKIVWLENRSSFGIHWFIQLGTGDIEYCVHDLQMEIIGNIYENPNLLQDGK